MVLPADDLSPLRLSDLIGYDDPEPDRGRLAPQRTTTFVLDNPSSKTYDRFGERELVEAARHDANAFAGLYRRYVDRIHAYAYRRSSSKTIAEDVTAATFEKALSGLGSYRWKEPGIGPWLFRIASNELVNVYRRDGRQARAIESIASNQRATSPVDSGSAVDDRAELLHALGKIRPRYQRALTLRYFADLNNDEAAAAMGVSRKTMAVIVHRAGASLRRAIESARDEVVTHG